MGVSKSVRAGSYCLAGLFCVSAPLFAADEPPPNREDTLAGIVGPRVRTGLELRVGATRSDNIGRVPDNEQSDTMLSAGAAIDLAHNGSLLDFEARGDIDRVEFLDDSFAGRVLGTVNGLANFEFVPERFAWRTQDTFGQLATDPFSPATPQNLENVNYFTTGPVVQFGLGSALKLELSGIYSLTDYATSPLDSDQYGGTASLIHPLSELSNVSINVTSERTEFDDIVGADYDRRSGYLRYAIQGSRTGMTLDAGYTEISQIGGDHSGVLGRLSFDRRVSPSSSVTLFLTDQISDSIDVFRDEASVRSIVHETEVISTPSTVEERGGGAGWAWARGRTGLAFSASINKELYETTPLLDRKITLLRLSFTRRLGPITTFGFEARHNDEKFETTGLDDKELELSAQLRWDVGSRTGIVLVLDRFDRSSNNPATEYTENRVGLNFTWRAFGADVRGQ
jgi:hypothetical protein